MFYCHFKHSRNSCSFTIFYVMIFCTVKVSGLNLSITFSKTIITIMDVIITCITVNGVGFKKVNNGTPCGSPLNLWMHYPEYVQLEYKYHHFIFPCNLLSRYMIGFCTSCLPRHSYTIWRICYNSVTFSSHYW